MVGTNGKTIKEIVEQNKNNLRDADLTGADLGNCKFLGKSNNPKILKQSQIKDFLLALGFKIEE